MRTVVEVLIAVLCMASAVTVAGAQTPARLPLIAILSPGSGSTPAGGVVPFKQALGDLGWVEGRTVRFETRYGDWQPDRTLAMARELVALKPDVLYTQEMEAT